MLNILVVEDEIIVGLALREELHDLGVHVVMAEDAETALFHLTNLTLDAAIVDVALPGMHGDEFARECRRRHPQMPLILSTGMHAADLRALFAGDTKVEVLEKPYHFSAVRDLLERLGVVFAGCAPQERSVCCLLSQVTQAWEEQSV